MGCRRLFVGNLASNTTTESVRAAFADFGEVTEVLLVTERSELSPAFGLVTMGSDGDAEQAISRLDGALIDGRPIQVNPADEQLPPSQRFLEDLD